MHPPLSPPLVSFPSPTVPYLLRFVPTEWLTRQANAAEAIPTHAASIVTAIRTGDERKLNAVLSKASHEEFKSTIGELSNATVRGDARTHARHTALYIHLINKKRGGGAGREKTLEENVMLTVSTHRY